MLSATTVANKPSCNAFAIPSRMPRSSLCSPLTGICFQILLAKLRANHPLKISCALHHAISMRITHADQETKHLTDFDESLLSSDLHHRRLSRSCAVSRPVCDLLIWLLQAHPCTFPVRIDRRGARIANGGVFARACRHKPLPDAESRSSTRAFPSVSPWQIECAGVYRRGESRRAGVSKALPCFCTR